MKKIIRFIVLALALVMIVTSMVGCSNETSVSWKGTTLKDNIGNVVESSNGGFVAETDNNVYFINGQGASDSNNAFGAVIKGALVGIKKTDLVNGDFDKAEVVIPKLFVASDYNQGVFIASDGYVYYASTSLEKDPDGNVERDKMVFVKTKLDGTGTQTLYTVGDIGTEYRIGEKEGVVYITFYNTNASELRTLNTQTGNVTVIAKTDAKVKGDAGESLTEKPLFLDGKNGVVAIFINTVYSEDYYADKVENEGIERSAETWNKVYAVGIDGTKTLVLNGETNDYTYKPTYVDGEYLFYTQTPNAISDGTAVTYAGKLSELSTVQTEVNTAITLNASVIIKDLDNAYWVNTDTKEIYFGSLSVAKKLQRQTVAKGMDIKSLIAVEGNLAYFYANDNKIYEITINDDTAEQIQVSRDTATSTWYQPEVLNVNGDKVIMFCDDSSIGNNYIGITNISKATKEASDDEEPTYSYTGDEKVVGFISIRTVSDKASYVTSFISSASITLEKDYSPNFETIDEAISIYESADKSVQAKISKENKDVLDNLKKAKELATAYYNLKGYDNYENLDENGKADFKALVDQALALRNAYKKISQSKDTAIQKLVPQNLSFYYQEAYKLVYPEEE